ncbi:Hypothetical protein D9617_4g001540 [Elsinoe fawcettii]|nr:Hypothetical protein D9617_4g001540 [Elsinoe fawcettii]
MPAHHPDPSTFEIAIICALPPEADAVLRTFEHRFDSAHAVHGDNNTYTCGVISGHHAVVVHMPGMGTVMAASVTAKLSISYPHIQLVVIAGVCGGIPNTSSREYDIFFWEIWSSAHPLCNMILAGSILLVSNVVAMLTKYWGDLTLASAD